MADFIDSTGVDGIIRSAGFDPSGNFELIYSAIHKAGRTSELNELDAATRQYFGALELPEVPTLYDYLVLSLRPKDLIVTFNWDPLLPQAFRRWRHLGPVLPQLAFLHGNVDVGVDYDGKVLGFLSDRAQLGRNLAPTRLLYPIEQKSYNADPFIADQWQRATDALGEAYYVTIFGYSAPTTDVEARSLLLKAWKENPTHTLAQFTIIDIRDPGEVKTSWSDFIVRTHGGVIPSFSHDILTRHPRRTCEAFAFATLQQDPWREDRLIEATSLSELENWIKPIIEEETSGYLSGEPHH